MEWMDIETCPKDGTFFDALRDGIRHTDCHFERGAVVKEHGYPSMTKIFLKRKPTHWMPRPEGLIEPYAANEYGEQYIP